MRIKLLADYCGRETQMIPYRKGDILEIDHQPAIELIQLGMAEEEPEKLPDFDHARVSKKVKHADKSEIY